MTMKVRMLVGKDVYYPGEIVELDAETATRWIRAGYAENIANNPP